MNITIEPMIAISNIKLIMKVFWRGSSRLRASWRTLGGMSAGTIAVSIVIRLPGLGRWALSQEPRRVMDAEVVEG